MAPSDALRRLRDQTGDTFLLAVVRVGFGLLLLNEAWLGIRQFSDAGYFDGYFHQPFLPESLVPSAGVYQVVLAAQLLAAALVVAGRGARPALLVAAGLLVYVMLCDRLLFHHYRHTMAAFSTLLAFSPCDRYFVLGRPANSAPGPLWAENAIKAQVSFMYLASGGSKLLDPEWRAGQMMLGMVKGLSQLMQSNHFPASVVAAMQTPLGGGVLAKGAISTELGLAFLLWWPRTRRLAIWVGLAFHLAISQMTPVRLFTIEMGLVYLLFATPDVGARVVRYDPRRHTFVQLIEGLDWLRRYKLAPSEGAAFVLVDRGGEEKRGLAAVALIFATLPVLFAVWPLVAALAYVVPLRRGSPRGAP